MARLRLWRYYFWLRLFDGRSLVRRPYVWLWSLGRGVIVGVSILGKLRSARWCFLGRCSLDRLCDIRLLDLKRQFPFRGLKLDGLGSIIGGKRLVFWLGRRRAGLWIGLVWLGHVVSSLTA